MPPVKPVIGTAIAVVLGVLALAHFFVHPEANGMLVLGAPKAPAESIILTDGRNAGGQNGRANPIAVSDSASLSMDSAVITPSVTIAPGILIGANPTLPQPAAK